MTQEEQQAQAAAIVKQVQAQTQKDAYARRDQAAATALLVDQLLAPSQPQNNADHPPLLGSAFASCFAF